MAFIETIPASQATGAVKAMYDRQQASYGYVPNYAKVFSHRPEVLARWGRLLAEISRPMDDRLYELATFAAATQLKSSACSMAHGRKLAEMIGEEGVRDIAAGKTPAELTAAEILVINFARKVAKDAASIDPADLQALKAAGYSAADIFDITTTVAGRSFLTKIVDALGVELDADVLQLDGVFREAMMVGRSEISNELEVMDQQHAVQVSGA